MKYPEALHVDSGNVFKGDVFKLMKEHSVPIKSVVTKYHHSFTAFVETFNKLLAIMLFKPQDAQEVKSGKDSKIWVKNLQKFVTKLNNSKLKRIGMTPAKAKKLENVELKLKPYEPQDVAPTDGLYRYLLESGEENKDTKRRATDNPGQRVFYYLADGPESAFVRKELVNSRKY